MTALENSPSRGRADHLDDASPPGCVGQSRPQGRGDGEIVLSESQKQAIEQIRDWYLNRRQRQQVFRVFGFAGVGKSTIVRYAIEELGISRGVLYATLTGKAALVLRKRGVPCQTIHSLIYTFAPASEEAMQEVGKKLIDLKQRVGEMTGFERTLTEAQIKECELQLKEMRKPKFVLNDESALRDADLLVLDEVSMVSDDQAADILGFGKPVLVLGDPGQLPPIKGSGSLGGPSARSDVFLHEIHRQAGDSAIIRLATMARDGVPIPHGRYSDTVWKLSQDAVTAADLLRADQVICGMNRTRYALNNAMRAQSGFEGQLPYGGAGEKLICLRNDHNEGLLNGMFIRMSNVTRIDVTKFFADISGEDLPERHEIAAKRCYSGHYLDHADFDPHRSERDWKLIRNLCETTWGWAITCHKAQGSGFENVIVLDDGWGRNALDRRRWLYTAVTRAESGLLILE